MKDFLKKDDYVDFDAPVIRKKANELFSDNMTDIEKARTAYEFVRDEIPHSFDCNANVAAAKASEVLEYGTGICHAKANLLSALLRLEGIPSGFCFQRLTLAEDDSLGYCTHALNAVFLEERWIKLDARGNIDGRNAEFSLDEPILLFTPREEYDELNYKGIYASPDMATMKVLEEADTLMEAGEKLPDKISSAPDILE